MGIGRAQHYHGLVPGKDAVLYKALLTGHQLRSVNLGFGLAHIGKMIAEGWGYGGFIGASGKFFLGKLYSKIVVFVACITDKDAGEHICNLCP